MSQFKTAIDISLNPGLSRQIGEAMNLLKGLDKQAKETSALFSKIKLGNGIFENMTKLKAEFGGIAATAVHGNQQIIASYTAMGGRLATEMRGLKGVSAEVATAMNREFKGAFAGAQSEIAGLNRQIAEMSSRMRGLGGGGGRSMRYGGGGHGGGGLLDTIAMGSQHSGVYAGLNVEHSVVGGLLEANGELQRQINLYRLGGAKPSDVAAARSAAFRSAVLVPDVGVAEQMKLLRELSGATGDEAGARSVLPQAAKTMSIMGAVTGRHSEEDMKRLFKFIELRGVAIDEHTHKIDVNKFGSELDYATKAMVAAQGLITSNDMLQFTKQAGSMAKGMSGDELFTTMLAGIEDMGGSRAGTSLTAVGRQFLGGIMTGGKVARLDQLGLLNRAGVDRSDPDKLKITDPTQAIRGYDVLTDPKKGGFGAFMEEVFRPALASRGITDRQKQNEELYRSVGTDTARRLMGLYISGHEQVGIVADRYRKAMSGGEGYDKIFGAGQDLGTSTKALSEAFTTLKTALGDAPAISGGLMAFARGVASFADMVKDRPAVGTAATLGGVGASASLLGYGALQTVRGFGLPAAATQLTTAAVHLEAAAAKLGGSEIAKDAAKAAPAGSVLAGLGLTGIGLGTIAAGAFAGYATGQTLPSIARREGLGAIDPATGEHLDTAIPQTTPWLRDWISSWFTSSAAKDEAVKIGKQSALSTADGFKGVDFAGTGALTANVTKTAFQGADFSGAGSAAATALLRSFLSLFAGMGGDGGAAGGSLIQRASFGGGFGANDNSSFGSASGVARSLGRGGLGGSGGAALGSVGSGGDYLATVGGRTYRSAYVAGGRERVGSWLDMLQRPVGDGGLGMNADKARAMVAMMQGESGINLNPGAIGDHGTSIGTGQWHAGRARGLMAMAAQMGLSWRDPRAQQAWFRHEMLGQYRGVYNAIQAAPTGDHALAIGIDRYESPAKKALAYRFRHPYLQGLRRSGAGEHPVATERQVPTAGPPPRQQMVEMHSHTYLDGKKIATTVTKHMAKAGRFPGSTGGPDTYGHHHGPSTDLTDAA